MDQFETAGAMQQLSMLFRAFPTSADLNSETTLKAYLIAIEGCTLAGLTEAVRRFIRGEVDDHNAKFAPTTAQLARVVRLEDQNNEIRRRYAGRKQIERATAVDVVIDAETRKRRVAQLTHLANNLKGFGE